MAKQSTQKASSTAGQDVWFHVLKCRPEKYQSNNNHFQVLVNSNGQKFWFTVNVRYTVPVGQKATDNVMYSIVDSYTHPITAAIKAQALPWGFTEIKETPGGIALDYVRGSLLPLNDLKVLSNANSTFTDLSSMLGSYIDQARRNTDIEVYAFGSKFPLPSDNRKGSNPFNLNPNIGLHDVHMNQGSIGNYAKSNAPWQDGALFFHNTATDQWTAIFLAFETQVKTLLSKTPIEPRKGTTVREDGVVRILAALVNPSGNERVGEFIYLANTTNETIRLDGWTIEDRQRRRQSLNGIEVPALEVTKVFLNAGTAQLGNGGGVITLYDNQDKKVAAATYTEADGKAEDRLVVF
ncbi:MAG: DUF2278 family protein [Saprospiraceae bacterium]